jgi:hypothetical protein
MYLCEVKIIGLVTNGQAAEKLAQEADSVITKPLEASRLKEVIDRLLGLKNLQ